MFDSSGGNTLSAGLVIEDAKFVALGAPRIGIGVDPATYDGLALSDALQALLAQSGALVTLRSQSSIDFADGTYNFSSIGFDAATLTGLDGGAVTVNADTVSLGNAGAPRHGLRHLQYQQRHAGDQCEADPVHRRCRGHRGRDGYDQHAGRIDERCEP